MVRWYYIFDVPTTLVQLPNVTACQHTNVSIGYVNVPSETPVIIHVMNTDGTWYVGMLQKTL